MFPEDKLKLIAWIFLYTIASLLFRRGETYDSWIGLENCQIGSYLIVFLHLIVGYLISKSIAIKKNKEEVEMERLGYVFENESDKMNS